MHITSSILFNLLIFNVIGLIKNSPVDQNVDEDESFEVSFHVVPGDGLNEETVTFGPPKREPQDSFSKLRRLISKRKRELVRSKKSTNTSEEENDYNYDELRKAYYGEVYELEREGLAYNYSDHKNREETVGDAIHTITDFKHPVDCKQEEYRNIGIQAMNCLWQDYWHDNKPGVKNRLLRRAIIIIVIWIAVYLLIVIPLWCTKGWCCCCCPCKLCHPRSVVLQAKKYMYENKPGEMFDPNNEIAYYEPTKYEKEAYLRLQYMIKTF